MLDQLPPGVRVKNSAKSPGRRNRHFGFNVAPIDLAGFADADFSQGCYIHPIFGLGLTRSGYYPHPICGGIDRVFGFDIGLKSLPAAREAPARADVPALPAVAAISGNSAPRASGRGCWR